MSTNVLVYSKSTSLKQEVKKMVNSVFPDDYQFADLTTLAAEIPDSDVLVIDTLEMNRKEIQALPDVMKRAEPRPTICLLSDVIESDLISIIQRYSTDFLVHSRLTATSFNNSIRYSLKKMSLQTELVNQEQRYMSLFTNSIDASFFLNGDWQIQAINPIFQEVFQLDSARISGLRFSHFIADETDFNSIQIALENLQHFETVIRFIRPENRTTFLGKLSISVINDTLIENGKNHVKVNGYHGTLKNVSRELRVSEAASKVQRVQENNRFARTLAHEIRNPLTTISLSVEQLREEFGNVEGAQIYLDILNRCMVRIDNLIDKLLQASEWVDSEKSEIELNALVLEAYEAAKDKAQMLKINLKLALETPFDIVKSDGIRIKLALSNLLSNAFESIEHDHGEVTIGTYIDDDYYCIFVEDNGKGINKSTKEKLFDPFFSLKANRGGMGLTTVQTITAEHQGHIKVESTPGKGAKFTISLPTAIRK